MRRDEIGNNLLKGGAKKYTQSKDNVQLMAGRPEIYVIPVSQIPHGQDSGWTQISVLWNQWLSACAMAWLNLSQQPYAATSDTSR